MTGHETLHERASALLAVSTVIFALRKDASAEGPPQVRLPLVRRIREPFEGRWALPGGPLRVGEDLGYAAARTLGETTGLTPRYLEQLYTFGDALRSRSHERVVSIVYWALVGSAEAKRASVGENVAWFAADELPELAFDQTLIVQYALWRLRTKMEHSRIAHAFLGERFTLAQLREVHEAVLGRPLDPANFRRTIESSGTVVATGDYLTGTPHRPPRLYRYNGSIDLADAEPLPPAAASIRRSNPMTIASVDTTIRLISRGELDSATCAPELAEAPWLFDAAAPSYGPGASQADPIPALAPRQGELPEEYRTESEEELSGRIHAAKATLGDRVAVMGHFYQRDEVVRFADFVGDSFQLANAAKARPEAEAIVFCGVHFMAETADIVSRPDQRVILPNLASGCSMADMADLDSVEECWEALEELYGAEPDADGRVPVIPVTYMNSSAALKAFCGERGGIVCTSSNAATVLEWAFERGQRVLFFPDQHLGRNTAKAMGVPVERIPLWNPRKPLGGSSETMLRDARVILWHGFCSVHKRFTVGQIEQARAAFPGVRVIVHPECPMEVVDAADESGSTDYIVKAIQAAPAGSTLAIGTEINLVQRLAAQFPQHTVFCLDSVVCPCSTMYRIHPGYLAWVLESLVRGEVVNQVSVPAAVAGPARAALERMLAARPDTTMAA